ncbi:MAG: coenzyme F420-0:L-glutamate ligase [Defluviitaleaceae bacterium]|nr:coenzyme F420-0:L-glutamate ligase [Defluviitaleaceae bacterium]
MRLTGTVAAGIRLPIIGAGDDLVGIVAEHVLAAAKAEGRPLADGDIIGVTEGIVAKAEGNFVTIDDIAQDVRGKFGGGEVGLVFPITSRNRFLNILKGISRGVDKLHVLLSYPQDEVGNPIMDADMLDEVADSLGGNMATAEEFQAACGGAYHMAYTGVDYISLYKNAGQNISVYLSKDPRDILKLTKNVIVGEIHGRNSTKKRLQKAGAQKVFTLSDILSESINGSGCNPEYGVLGSNLSTENSLKLFPARAHEFVHAVQAYLKEKSGAAPEVLVYGDGAFKDPVCGIWELADPVVSPGYTARLGGQPNEIKIKFVADNVYSGLQGQQRQDAVKLAIKEKHNNQGAYREGTTPRVYADLVGSLCDLISGSGDKGTPVVLIRGYFDDMSVE